MGMMENALVVVQRKQLVASERTNELLTELLAEIKHANELTRWQIEQRKAVV